MAKAKTIFFYIAWGNTKGSCNCSCSKELNMYLKGNNSHCCGIRGRNKLGYFCTELAFNGSLCAVTICEFDIPLTAPVRSVSESLGMGRE